MSEITTKAISELRAKTDSAVGMLECKKALAEVNGDVDRAIELLREQGMLIAENRAEASEYYENHRGRGVVLSAADTDFLGSKLYRYKGQESEIAIPFFVTEIDVGAFKNCTTLKYVAIPGSVASIGASSFEGCSALESVELSEGLKVINQKAFARCSSLKSIRIPDGVVELAYEAFRGCSTLENVELSDSTKKVSFDSFSGCEALKRITIPSCLKFVDSRIFGGSHMLKEVVILDGIASIRSYTFWMMPKLQSIVIPTSVQEISNLAFMTINGVQENRDIEESVNNQGSFKQRGLLSFGKKLTSAAEKVLGIDNKGIPEHYKVSKISELLDSELFIADCRIMRQNLTIYGEPGSAAESYAMENHLKFSDAKAFTAEE